MARISMIVCDLCKEEIKEDDTSYDIVLSSYKKKPLKSGSLVRVEESQPKSQEEGEICSNCHRSLVARLNKLPDDILRTQKIALTFPNKPINPHEPAQFDWPLAPLTGAIGQKSGENVSDELSEGQINSQKAKQLSEGEFKVKSRAHMIKRPKYPKCTHDKKSFGDNGKFICLLCQEILGAV